MRRLAAGLLFSVLSLTLAVPASAALSTDLVNWTETWVEFDLSANDWTISQFSSDPDSIYDLTPFDPTIGTTSILAGGFNFIGTLFEITLPNFFDPLPDKLVDIHFVGFNSGASGGDLPSVLSITGADAPFEGPPGPAQPVFGTLMDDGVEFVITDQGADWIEHWEMHPNPDFETLTLFVPVGFELQSIHITTQSLAVPEPSIAGLLGLGLLGLAWQGRKRHA